MHKRVVCFLVVVAGLTVRTEAVDAVVISSTTNKPIPQKRALDFPPATSTNATMSLTIGWENGTGDDVNSMKGSALKPIRLRFQNNDRVSQAVMPELDGSNVHWRYPYYDLEVVAADGTVLQPTLVPRCGNVDPLKKDDVVLLKKGEVFQTSITSPFYQPKPGKYKVRVHYAARKDASVKGVPLGQNDAKAVKAMQKVWEGTAVSNWIELEITP